MFYTQTFCFKCFAGFLPKYEWYVWISGLLVPYACVIFACFWVFSFCSGETFWPATTLFLSWLGISWNQVEQCRPHPYRGWGDRLLCAVAELELFVGLEESPCCPSCPGLYAVQDDAPSGRESQNGNRETRCLSAGLRRQIHVVHCAPMHVLMYNYGMLRLYMTVLYKCNCIFVCYCGPGRRTTYICWCTWIVKMTLAV